MLEFVPMKPAQSRPLPMVVPPPPPSPIAVVHVFPPMTMIPICSVQHPNPYIHPDHQLQGKFLSDALAGAMSKVVLVPLETIRKISTLSKWVSCYKSKNMLTFIHPKFRIFCNTSLSCTFDDRNGTRRFLLYFLMTTLSCFRTFFTKVEIMRLQMQLSVVHVKTLVEMRTIFRKVVELVRSNMENHSYIVPLDSAIEYVEYQGRIDILGLAVHVTSPRKIHSKKKDVEFDARDIVLIDKSMRPSTLTVWLAFVSAEAQAISDVVASRPPVLVTRVAASKFGGGCWRTTFFSTIQLNYDGPEAVTLKQWESENVIEIARIAESLQANVAESSRTILPIAALTFQEDGSTVWIKGVVKNVINPDKCVYASCSICKCGTETPVGEKFACSRTDTPHIGKSVYRCNLQVHFEDESSAIKLTLFQELAEKILKRTAEQISCLSHEERLSLVSDFVDSIHDRQLIVKLLAKQFGSCKKQLRFSAQQIEEISE